MLAEAAVKSVDKYLCFDSGVSRWINPLPDIALHTLQLVEETDWPDSVTSSPSRDLIIKSRRCHKRVALNVGGVRWNISQGDDDPGNHIDK